MRFLLPVLYVAFVSNAFSGTVEDVSPQRGHSVAPINWADETGRVRRLSEFSGFPVVVLPIYTRCPGACIANVDQLKTALSESSADPRQFRVLLFSFDVTDTPEKLTAYRTREKIPLGWFVGTGTQQNIDALLESIGFQYGRAGTRVYAPECCALSRFQTSDREMDLRNGLLGWRRRSCIKSRSRRERLDWAAFRVAVYAVAPCKLGTLRRARVLPGATDCSATDNAREAHVACGRDCHSG